jgi:hypothetical protein
MQYVCASHFVGYAAGRTLRVTLVVLAGIRSVYHESCGQSTTQTVGSLVKISVMKAITKSLR